MSKLKPPNAIRYRVAAIEEVRVDAYRQNNERWVRIRLRATSQLTTASAEDVQMLLSHSKAKGLGIGQMFADIILLNPDGTAVLSPTEIKD